MLCLFLFASWNFKWCLLFLLQKRHSSVQQSDFIFHYRAKCQNFRANANSLASFMLLSLFDSKSRFSHFCSNLSISILVRDRVQSLGNFVLLGAFWLIEWVIFCEKLPNLSTHPLCHPQSFHFDLVCFWTDFFFRLGCSHSKENFIL